MTRNEPELTGSPALSDRIREIRLVAFDFDGVFTDNMVYVAENGAETVRCFRGDGFGLRKLEHLGIQTVVISTETNSVVEVRCRKLKIRCVHGCDDKLGTLRSIARESALSLQQIAFVGNDINDMSCLTSVGLSVVVNDAHADVIPHAHYRTKTPGGYGAVREICDLFERVLKNK